MQKFALYSGHGMVFGRFFLFCTYGMYLSQSKRTRPWNMYGYTDTYTRIKNADGIFLFMVT